MTTGRGNPKREEKKLGAVTCPVAFCSWHFSFPMFEDGAYEKAVDAERKHWAEYHDDRKGEDLSSTSP